MYFHMMTRRISFGLAIAGLVIASPAIVDIASHFMNRSNPLFLIVYLPDTYAIVVTLCGFCVFHYSYGLIIHKIYVNINETVILEKKFRELFDNPFSRFLVWRETLDVYKKRRGW